MLNFSAGPDGLQNALLASDTKIILTSRRFIELGKLQGLIDALQGVTLHYMEDLKSQFTWVDKLWLKAYAMRFPRRIGVLKELESLHIWHFRPKDNTFSSLDIPESLIELQINWASPESLESLPTLPLLRRLEIHRCRNLHLLGDLSTKYPCLEHLVIDACGQVPRSEGERVIQDLPNLTHAYVQNIKLV